MHNFHPILKFFLFIYLFFVELGFELQAYKAGIL
jgi:hypothetical protein